MDNAKVLHALDEFAKTKPKDISKELEDYIRNVAGTGDHVYQWSLVKCLFRQKLVNVISEFYESCPMMDVPLSPNVDAFNYESIKTRLLHRYDNFTGAPFTVQRLAELLTAPRKQYNRVDKFMRAIEKNIWVVSTREPGSRDTITQINYNGVLSPTVLANNVKTPQERLKRQSELFEDDEEEDDENDDETTESSSAETTSQEVSCESSLASTTSEGSSERLENSKTSESAPENQDSHIDSELVIAESIPEVSEEPTVNENSLTSATSSDEQEETKTDVEDCPEDEEPASSKDNDPQVVTEVSEPEGEENIDDDITVRSVTVEEPPENEEIKPEVKTKTDLKRKLVTDDDEVEIFSKKLETEELAPVSVTVHEETTIEQPADQAKEVAIEQKTEVITAISEVTDTDVEESVSEESSAELERIEVVEEDSGREPDRESSEMAEEEIIKIIEVEDIAEREMESADIEEKAEMVVEEQEQAMEVDEANSQSPMEDCTAGEPMDADIGQS